MVLTAALLEQPQAVLDARTAGCSLQRAVAVVKVNLSFQIQAEILVIFTSISHTAAPLPRHER